jgi:hypothetical protein
MTQVSKCISCGGAVTFEAAGAFAGAPVVGCLCTSCSDRHTAEADGVVLHLREEDGAGRFPLGRITVTPGAIAALSDAGEHVGTYLMRHVRGDWGSFGHFDQTARDRAKRRAATTVRRWVQIWKSTVTGHKL